MYHMVHFISYNADALPTMVGFTNMVITMTMVMAMSALVGVAYAAVNSIGSDWKGLADGHLDMVYPEADSLAFYSEDPEILFFGEMLPEEAALMLPMEGRLVVGEPTEFATAIQRVAGVNKAGRLYDPSNGRFIARKDLGSWVVPADLIAEVVEAGAFRPASRVLN